MTARWEQFPHEADMGIRGFGTTMAEAFEQAALAMTAVVTDLEAVEPREAVTIECTYTALRVARENDEWIARTVVDV